MNRLRTTPPSPPALPAPARPGAGWPCGWHRWLVRCAGLLLLAGTGPSTGAAQSVPAAAAVSGAAVSAGAVRIVAAENFYGDVARQLAGPDAQIVSVLSNPDADPHLFETDAATARAVANAQLLIYNGAHYDDWMTRLIAGSHLPPERVIDVAALMHRQGPHVNPHLWYDPATMPALATALAAHLRAIDPANAASYQRRLAGFLLSLRVLDAQVLRLRRLYTGVPVTATEPVADDLTAALGLVMRNQEFQLAIMNNTEPGARETAEFEHSLRSHAVRLLIYNRQADSNIVQRLIGIARQAGVPIVGVTETEPPTVDYQLWMLDTLGALERALRGRPP